MTKSYKPKVCVRCGATYTPVSSFQRFCKECPAGDKQSDLRACSKCGAMFEGRVGSFYCRPCDAATAKQLKNSRIEAGRCTKCDKPNDRPTKQTCTACFELFSIRQRTKRIGVKRQAIEALGGGCNDCGLVSEYAEIYDFHHADYTSKEEGIGYLLGRGTFEAIAEELQKCVLLCSNCHRIRHVKEGKPSAFGNFAKALSIDTKGEPDGNVATPPQAVTIAAAA